MKRTLITSALPYANGYIHLGHLAGAYLPADMYARFLRLIGEEVLYICGSDEHGVAITISAEKEKTTPKAIIDKYHSANLDSFKKFGMSFDIYSRTSNEAHKETSIDFFDTLMKNGYLSEREEEQFFDVKANIFLPDRYVEGTCPNCGDTSARGDQCDKCGAYYEQTELKNPRSTISNTAPELKKTTHWYLKFGMFQSLLEKYVESNTRLWKDNVLNQAKSWLKVGLADRAITRDLDWGVKIENASTINKSKAVGKVLYVWFDAVLGYITFTKEWAQAHPDKNNWEIWWKDPDTEHIAFIGKDNIVFHTLMLPALEMAYGGFNLPKNVPANEFLNLEGEKFSKSRNWSIDLKDFIDDFNSEQSVDALRYSLAKILPESKDSDFTWRDYQAFTNNELAAILGNFVNRTVQFIYKNMAGLVPLLSDKYINIDKNIENIISSFEKKQPTSFDEAKSAIEDILSNSNNLNQNDIILLYSLWSGIKQITALYKKFRFKDAVMETMNIARAANKYFNDEEPWKTIKNNPEESYKTLYVCSQLIYSLSILFAPILPYTSAKMQMLFGLEPVVGNSNNAKRGANYFQKAMVFNIAGGTPIATEAPVLFSKIEDDVIKLQVAKLGATTKKTHIIEDSNGLVSIDDFSKIKLKTGLILEAEAVPKSKKLLKLKVKVGENVLQILAGIAEYYNPEYLIGRVVVVVANLKPAKLFGLESQGMLLCASDDDKKLVFITPESEIGDGVEVR